MDDKYKYKKFSNIIMINERTEKCYKKIIEKYGELIEDPPETVNNKLQARKLSKASIKGIICAFKWKTKNPEYSKIINKINEELSQEKESHTNKFKKIKWSELQEPTGYGVEDVIKGIYTMFPPRRLSDYVYMIYIENEDEIGEYNYYVSETKEFVFKRYKTSRKFGEQHFKVPSKLNKLIEIYIKENEVVKGDNLLKYNGNKNKFSDSTLKRKLNKIFGTSVDGIRHSYITNLYKDGKKLLYIDDISAKMAHDVRTHLSYLDKENLD